MNVNGQALDYRATYLGSKPLTIGSRTIVGPETTVASVLSGSRYDRRTHCRRDDEATRLVARKANDLMATLWETLPEIREARVSRWWKILEATDGDLIAGEVVRVVTLRGRTLGWWP